MFPILHRARQLHLGLHLTFRAAIFLSHVGLTFALEWIPANFFAAAAGRQFSVAHAQDTSHLPTAIPQGSLVDMDSFAPILTSVLIWTEDVAPFPAHSRCFAVKVSEHTSSPISSLLVGTSPSFPGTRVHSALG